MEQRFNEEQLVWIDDVLDQYGEFLADLLQESIEAKHLKDTGELENSINYRVDREGVNPVLHVSFMSYGRAIEIRYHKSRNSTKFSAPNTNQLIWGIRSQKSRNRKKDARWYAKNAYGSLNRLIGILSWEFGEEEIRRVKGILQARKIREQNT